MRSFAGVSIRVQEVQLAMADHDFANIRSLGKSNDVPALISAILEDDESFQACESAATRLNEILYYEALAGSEENMYERHLCHTIWTHVGHDSSVPLHIEGISSCPTKSCFGNQECTLG